MLRTFNVEVSWKKTYQYSSEVASFLSSLSIYKTVVVPQPPWGGGGFNFVVRTTQTIQIYHLGMDKTISDQKV